MKKFEYKTLLSDCTGFWLGGNFDSEQFQDILNQNGQKGRELVSCFTTAKGIGESKHVIAVLKREIE